MNRYIVIEGLIGVGKTSLCRLLERELSARLILEPAEDNPFLASFYSDPERFALPAQMFYLSSRYQQQVDLRQQHLFSNLIVSDYLFDKDRIFAEMTLSGHELALYNRFASLLGESILRPDFVIFLDSPTDVILSRIARRAISSEQAIGADYLDTLRDRYYRLWERYTHAPVHKLDTAAINYVDDPAGREAILGMVRGWLRGGETGSGAPASAAAPQQMTEREDQPSLFGPEH